MCQKLVKVKQSKATTSIPHYTAFLPQSSRSRSSMVQEHASTHRSRTVLTLNHTHQQTCIKGHSQDLDLPISIWQPKTMSHQLENK